MIIYCVGCKNSNEQPLGRWHYLDRYYGINGYVCSKCWGMVRHTSAGVPVKPEKFTFFMLKYMES